MGLATAIDCAIMLLCSCLGDNKIKEEMERFTVNMYCGLWRQYAVYGMFSYRVFMSIKTMRFITIAVVCEIS